MPKTNFQNGTTLVTAEFLNKIFRADGGHKHDGVDADGHAGKIDLRTEITAGPNGSFTIPVDNSDVQVLQYDHAASGNAIIRTDALTLAGAPRDATRRAQAPLDRSLYVQNTVKALAELTWDGSAWSVAKGYNVGASVVNSGDGLSYEIALLDYSVITGIVMATIDGSADLLPDAAPRYYVRAEVDLGGAIRFQPRWFDADVLGGPPAPTWRNWRDAAPTGPAETVGRIVMVVY